MIPARYASPAARAWLARPRRARLLHASARACALVDDAGEVLALVGEGVGPGPFALVVDAPPRPGLAACCGASAGISRSAGVLRVGHLVVDTSTARPWSPVPPWHRWRRAARDPAGYAGLARRCLDACRDALQPAVASAANPFFEALAAHDRVAAAAAAAGLAGLGSGLTPAGDDVIVGALHGLFATGAAWARPETIAERAAARTTLLSAAWLHAAGRGEAAAAWHALVQARAAGARRGLVLAMRRIMATGHDSGRHSLYAFLRVTGTVPEPAERGLPGPSDARPTSLAQGASR